MLLNNGCSVHKTTDWELLAFEEIKKEDVVYLNELRKGYDLDFTVSNDKDYFVIGERANEYTKEDGGLVYVEVQPISIEEATSGKHTFFKSMFLGNENEIARFVKDKGELINSRYSGVLSQKYIYETLPKGANKGVALKKLAEKLNIPREEVMAIGDGNNDIEMLKFAGVGVAMGNGTKMAKDAANYITDTNENNGVAKAIEKFLGE